MIKSNPSLVKRRVKRTRRRSALLGAIVGALTNSRSAAAASAVKTAIFSSSPLVRRNRRRLVGCAALLSLLLVLMGGTGTTTTPGPVILFLRHSSTALARQASAIGGGGSRQPSSSWWIDADADSSQSPYAFPPVIDLWLSDAPVLPSRTTSQHNPQEDSFTFVIGSCTDQDAGGDPCRLAQLNDELTREVEEGSTVEPERVGVLRSPGRIGTALEEAVRILIVNQTDPTPVAGEASSPRDVRLLPTSYVEAGDGTENVDKDKKSYERIVRIATQPLLLDAMDLALEASESNDEITLEGVLCMLRLLVQWHCHHNMVSLDVAPILAVSAQAILAHPTNVRTRLAWYLNRTPREVHESEINEWLNDISHRIMRRIDECSAVATQLQRRLLPDHDLLELVQQVVKEEADICDNGSSAKDPSASALTTARCDSGSGHRRLAEIGEILLSAPDANDLRRRDPSSMCGRFPSIRLCEVPLDRHGPQLLKQQ